MTTNKNPASGNGAAVKPIVWMQMIRDLPIGGVITGSFKAVLLIIGLMADRLTGQVKNATTNNLIKKSGFSRRFIIKTIDIAVNLELLKEERVGYKDRRYWQKKYTLQIPPNYARLSALYAPSQSMTGCTEITTGCTEITTGCTEITQSDSHQTQAQSGLEADFSGGIRSFSDLYSERVHTCAKGEESPLTPHSLSTSSNSSQEGEIPKVGGNVEAATAQSPGGDSGLGCQNQAVKIATKANGKPTTGRERQHQGIGGAAQPLPASWTLSDDEVRAIAGETGWNEGEVKRVFGKFQNCHLSRGKVSHSWPAEWALWVQRELEHAAKNGKAPERKRPLPPLMQADQGQVVLIDKEAGKVAMAEIRRIMRQQSQEQGK